MKLGLGLVRLPDWRPTHSRVVDRPYSRVPTIGEWVPLDDVDWESGKVPESVQTVIGVQWLVIPLLLFETPPDGEETLIRYGFLPVGAEATSEICCATLTSADSMNSRYRAA